MFEPISIFYIRQFGDAETKRAVIQCHRTQCNDLPIGYIGDAEMDIF